MHIIIKNLRSTFSFITLTTLLSACSFFDKDNTPIPKPLTAFRSEVSPKVLWSTKTGPVLGDEYLKMQPTMSEKAIFTAGANGTVTALNKRNGQIYWQHATGLSLLTSPGVGEHSVVIGGRRGQVVALSEKDGSVLWKAQLTGEILSRPAINQGVVIVKTVDGNLTALSSTNGTILWSYKQNEPNVILHGASGPILQGNSVLVGFANGTLNKFSLHDGELLWQQPLAVPAGAFTIERMVDIDADPLIYNHALYAATYQGKIASLDSLTGKTLWSHDISSYTGMAADSSVVTVSDAKSYVWSFGADSGLVNWRQTQLEARNLSGPALMGNYVVVGDAQGYLHWLSKIDGHVAGRVKLGSGIYAAPIVENKILYVLTNRGDLAAYTLG